MKRSSIIICGIVYVLGITLPALAQEDGEWQLWATQSMEVKFQERIKMTIEEEERFSRDVRELSYHHTDGGIEYEVSDWLDAGINYRQVYELKKRKWIEESRPHINGTLKYKWQGLKFADRNRLEFRIIKGRKDNVRYRNKFTLSYPLEIWSLKAEPYVADEIFVSSDGTNLNRNRFYVGLKMKVLKNLKPEVFYMWQASKSGKSTKWTDHNVIGLKVGLAF